MTIDWVKALLVKIEECIAKSNTTGAMRLLSRIRKELSPSFYIPYGSNYKKDFLEKTLFPVPLKLVSHKDEGVSKNATDLISHISYVCACASSLEFIRIVEAIINNQEYSKGIKALLPAFQRAIINIGEEEKKESLNVIRHIIDSIVSIDYKLVPEHAWITLGDYLPADEIVKYLERFSKEDNFGKCAAFLIRSQGWALSGMLFDNYSFSFLNNMLEQLQTSMNLLEYDKILIRMLNEISNVNAHTFTEVCLLATNLMRYHISRFSDAQKITLKSIIDFIASQELLTNEKNTEEYTFGVLDVLLMSARIGYFDKNILKASLPKMKKPTEYEPLRILYFEALLLCVEKGDNPSFLHQYSETFSPSIDPDQYIKILDIIIKYLQVLRVNDPLLIDHFILSCTHPLPLDPKVAAAVLKFLNAVTTEELLNTKSQATPEKIIYRYMKLDDPLVNKQITNFIKKHNIEIDCSKVDLFGNSSAIFIKMVDKGILKEMFFSQLINPHSLPAVFELLRRNPFDFYDYTSFNDSSDQSREIFNNTFKSLETIANTIGIDLKKLYQSEKLSTKNIQKDFLAPDDIVSLFVEINRGIHKTYFGLLVDQIILTLTTYLDSIHHEENIETICKIVLILSNIIWISPQSTLEFFLKAYVSCNNIRNSQKLINIIQGSLKTIINLRLSTKFSVSFLKFVLKMNSNVSNILENYPSYVLTAIKLDRQIAKTFSSYIHQPLNLFPTFLSFIGIDEHKEWVATCSKRIDPSEWVLDSNDIELIDKYIDLGENQDSMKRTIISRLEGMRTHQFIAVQESVAQMHAFAIDMNLSNIQPLYSTKRSDTYTPVNISDLKIPEALPVHSTEPGTVSNLTSFLYYSSSPLPSNINGDYLNDLALSNSKNMRLLSGFFLWASQNKYSLDVDKWTKKLRIWEFNKESLLAVCLFLLNVKGPIAQYGELFTSIIDKFFVRYGYKGFSKENVVDAYETKNGLLWYLARNIILMDTEYFDDHPLILSELTLNRKKFKDYFVHLPEHADPSAVISGFISVCNVLAKPDPNDMELDISFPSNYKFPLQVRHFKQKVFSLTARKVPKDLIEALINCLKKQSIIPLNFFNFFSTCQLVDDQYERVHDLFFSSQNSASTRRIIAPVYRLLEPIKNINTIYYFYAFKPPSFSRAFFRSLKLNIPEIASINPQNLQTAKRCLTVVFPDLCYASHAQYGMKMWGNGTIYSKLLFGFAYLSMGKHLLQNLKLPCQESLTAFKMLCILPKDALQLLLPYASRDMLVQEFAKIFLKTATSRLSNMTFAYNAINLLVSMVGLETSLLLVGTKAFLNRPNFACTMIIIQRVKCLLKSANNEDGVNYISELQKANSDIFENELKKSAFSDFHDKESIDIIIHKNYDESLNDKETLEEEEEVKEEPEPKVQMNTAGNKDEAEKDKDADGFLGDGTLLNEYFINDLAVEEEEEEEEAIDE